MLSIPDIINIANMFLDKGAKMAAPSSALLSTTTYFNVRQI